MPEGTAPKLTDAISDIALYEGFTLVDVETFKKDF